MATKRKAERKHLFFLWRAQGGKCAICGDAMPYPPLASSCHLRFDKDEPTVDHIFSVSRGGLNTLENMTAVHMGCNWAKGHYAAKSYQRKVWVAIAPHVLMERLRLANARDFYREMEGQ